MLFLAFKRMLPRGLIMALAVALAVTGVEYFQSGRLAFSNALLIFAIALVATFAIYVPVEYHNLKTDARREHGRQQGQ